MVKKRKRKSSYPMIKGVIVGLMGGLLLVLAVTFYVNDILLPLPSKDDSQSKNTETSKRKPRLSFYDSLLEESFPTKDNVATLGQSDKLSAGGKKYFIQVAAFRSNEEADNMRAKLALAGFTSRIEISELEKDDIWFRVRLGPYETETELWATKTALSQHDFEADIVTKPN
tara:strand:+ start:42 stop:554 length:513 start_codon:yes stop_codon:yes gene_type:complete